MRRTLCCGVIVLFAGTAMAAPLEFGDGMRMNQIQVIGTHNSYHQRPARLGLLMRLVPATEDWDYAHAPLNLQLDRGVRSFELDVHNTSAGWAVFHLPLLDSNTSCPTWRACLELVREWSEAHPHHVPISFLIEYKDEGRLIDQSLGDFDEASMERLDADVRAVFGPDKLITPDDVRGDFATLEAAILTRGWPTLASARGKVFFILHERGSNRERYVAEHPALRGRAMFLNSEPGRPDAATIIRDNPNAPDLEDLVRKGYWVRSTCDGRINQVPPDTSKREKALACGAQIVSTDYPPGSPHPRSGFVVELPGGVPARCNPINVSPDCAEKSLE